MGALQSVIAYTTPVQRNQGKHLERFTAFQQKLLTDLPQVPRDTLQRIGYPAIAKVVNSNQQEISLFIELEQPSMVKAALWFRHMSPLIIEVYSHNEEKFEQDEECVSIKIPEPNGGY